MLVTSYSTHAPVNLWCEHALFYGNDIEAKATRGSTISMQTVELQSPVSNLNLLCHLKSPWTNLTLACNNHLEECLSVLCMWVSVWPDHRPTCFDHGTGRLWQHTCTQCRRLIKTLCSTVCASPQRVCSHRLVKCETVLEITGILIFLMSPNMR